MEQDNLDKIFKNKFESSSNISKNIGWEKEDAWNKLIDKRKKYRMRKFFMYSSAAVFFAIVFLSFPKLKDVKNENVISNY